jgi:hypothetical protein
MNSKVGQNDREFEMGSCEIWLSISIYTTTSKLPLELIQAQTPFQLFGHEHLIAIVRATNTSTLRPIDLEIRSNGLGNLDGK